MPVFIIIIMLVLLCNKFIDYVLVSLFIMHRHHYYSCIWLLLLLSSLLGSWVDVRDAAAAHVAALRRGAAAGRYLVTSEDGAGVRDMAAALRSDPVRRLQQQQEQW